MLQAYNSLAPYRVLEFYFASRGEQIMGGYAKQLHFWISLEFSLAAKCNEHFIKKISQLKSDIRSRRCKNFSLKQASGLMGGGGVIRTPPDPSPGSDTGYGCSTTRILPMAWVKYTRDQKVRSPMQKNIQDKDIASFSKVRLKQILPNYTFRRNNNNT